MVKILLKLEDGILLKQYSLPWRDEGFRTPPAGWTPIDIDAIQEMADKLLTDDIVAGQELDKHSGQRVRLKAWQTFEQLHNDRREMWMGWIPIIFQHDRKIGKAYRRLFVELNDGKRPPRQSMRAVYPKDGMYELKNNHMVPLEVDNESNA